VFHRFGKAKFPDGGLVLGSTQFSLLPQLPQKSNTKSDQKRNKNNLCYSKSLKRYVVCLCLFLFHFDRAFLFQPKQDSSFWADLLSPLGACHMSHEKKIF